MRIAICDDEPEFVDGISEEIKAYAAKNNEIVYIDSFINGSELMSELCNKVKYDIIFLDICMPSVNGIDLGNYIREELNDNITQIVYVSSEQQYAMDLFKVRPMDFLIKPVTSDNIKETMDKAYKLIGINNNIFTYEKNGMVYRVQMSKIRYVANSKRKIKLLLADGEEEEFYGNMDTVYDALRDNNFIRVHKSYIVNCNYIKSISSAEIYIDNEEKVPVSRSWKNEIERIFNW
ncbi:MAG: LytTR family DNA-binding domain-containing protein [Lachnospira sp.]|nr:LytTR family DNA-binding domain-containing protein [Lachnospira sp.]MDD5828331.1 LytTR family DNA-binding domain-containing protein [Lachnospira sp.]